MGLFRSRRREPTHRWPVHVREPAEFTGIAPGASLYEFETPDGVPVRLHDMSFVGFDYAVRSRTLVIRFRYDDPRWTPPQAADTPVAVFTFTGVQVWQWEDDVDSVQIPADVRGEVRIMDWFEPTNVFSLGTIDTTLLWSADRCAVHLLPADAGDQPAGGHRAPSPPGSVTPG